MEQEIPNKPTTFDPSVTYSWQPDDKFYITGVELNAMHRAHAALVNGNITNAGLILTVANTLSLSKEILQREVEAGNIKPKEEPKVIEIPTPDGSVPQEKL